MTMPDIAFISLDHQPRCGLHRVVRLEEDGQKWKEANQKKTNMDHKDPETGKQKKKQKNHQRLDT